MTSVTLAAIVLTLAALLHLVRLILGWDSVIGGWSAPMWLSVVGIIIAGGIAIGLRKEVGSK